MNWDADIDLGKTRIEEQINQIQNNLPPGTQITVEKIDLKEN